MANVCQIHHMLNRGGNPTYERACYRTKQTRFHRYGRRSRRDVPRLARPHRRIRCYRRGEEGRGRSRARQPERHAQQAGCSIRRLLHRAGGPRRGRGARGRGAGSHRRGERADSRSARSVERAGAQHVPQRLVYVHRPAAGRHHIPGVHHQLGRSQQYERERRRDGAADQGSQGRGRRGEGRPGRAGAEGQRGGG